MPAELIGRFCACYPNAETAADYRYNLTLLFSRTGVCHPAQLDEAGVTAYCTHGDRPANNTVYQRLSQVRTFLRWCRSDGVCDNPVAERLATRESPLRSYQRTYGFVATRTTQAPTSASSNSLARLTYSRANASAATPAPEATSSHIRRSILGREHR